MYCEQESKGNGHKLNKEKYNGLKSQLNKTLEAFIDDNVLSSEDRLVLEGFESALTNLRNTSHPTLQHKYDFLMSKTSNEIKEAVEYKQNVLNYQHVKHVSQGEVEAMLGTDKYFNGEYLTDAYIYIL